MKQIGLAMHNHESTYRSLPASYTTNSDGEKLLSWKVALLPFLEGEQFYSQIEGKEIKSWDDPNVPVLKSPLTGLLTCFRSVRSKNPPTSNESNVFLIASAEEKEAGNTFFIDGQRPSFRQCTDGISNTIFAVMLANHSRPWASPENLTPEEAFQLIQGEDRYVIAAFLDGSVRRIPTTIDKVTFMALTTRDGGEVIPLDF